MDTDEDNVLDKIVEANDNQESWRVMTIEQLLQHCDMLIANSKLVSKH